MLVPIGLQCFHTLSLEYRPNHSSFDLQVQACRREALPALPPSMRLGFISWFMDSFDGWHFVKSRGASAQKCPATWSYKIQSPHGSAKELFRRWHQNLLMTTSIFRIVKNWVFQVPLDIHNVVFFCNFLSLGGFCQCFQIHTTKSSSSAYLPHQAWTTTSRQCYGYPNDHYSPEYNNQV